MVLGQGVYREASSRATRPNTWSMIHLTIQSHLGRFLQVKLRRGVFKLFGEELQMHLLDGGHGGMANS